MNASDGDSDRFEPWPYGLAPRLRSCCPEVAENEQLWAQLQQTFIERTEGRYEMDLAAAFFRFSERCMEFHLFLRSASDRFAKTLAMADHLSNGGEYDSTKMRVSVMTENNKRRIYVFHNNKVRTCHQMHRSSTGSYRVRLFGKARP